MLQLIQLALDLFLDFLALGDVAGDADDVRRPRREMIFADINPVSWLPSLRWNSASKLSLKPLARSSATILRRSAGFFQTGTAMLDFPIASSRLIPVIAVKPWLISTIVPSSRRVITAASGPVLKINVKCLVASAISALARWLTIMIRPQVQMMLAMMASR